MTKAKVYTSEVSRKSLENLTKDEYDKIGMEMKAELHFLKNYIPPNKLTVFWFWSFGRHISPWKGRTLLWWVIVIVFPALAIGNYELFHLTTDKTTSLLFIPLAAYLILSILVHITNNRRIKKSAEKLSISVKQHSECEKQWT